MIGRRCQPHTATGAEHFDAVTQQRRALRVFAARLGNNRWVLVDWTNPTTRGTTGEYEGLGSTPEEVLRKVLEDWDEDNRYPDGGIIYSVDRIPRVMPFSGNFETDGSSLWDNVSNCFEWIGLGAAVVAGVVTLIAPVPGSQVVSAFIWPSILSGTGSAALNIGQRHAGRVYRKVAPLFDPERDGNAAEVREPSMAAMAAASLRRFVATGSRRGLPVRRLGAERAPTPRLLGRRCAEVEGFNVHAKPGSPRTTQGPRGAVSLHRQATRFE